MRQTLSAPDIDFGKKNLGIALPIRGDASGVQRDSDVFQRLVKILRVTFRVPVFAIHFQGIAELEIHLLDVLVTQRAPHDLIHLPYRKLAGMCTHSRRAFTTKSFKSQEKKRKKFREPFRKTENAGRAKIKYNVNYYFSISYIFIDTIKKYVKYGKSPVLNHPKNLQKNAHNLSLLSPFWHLRSV